jgi:hypothetical protein
LQYRATELAEPPATDDSIAESLHDNRSAQTEKGRTMKKLLTSLVASAFTVAALGLTAPADAAPAGPSSVDATIDQLRARGLDVIVNRVGTAPTEQCTVTAVRPGQLYSRSDTGSGKPGSWDDIVTTVTGNTVYVDIAC